MSRLKYALFKPVILWDASGSWCPARHRKHFVATRTSLSDSEFIRRGLIPSELVQPVLAIRQAMGRMSDVPPELIYPEDKPPELIRLMFEWDDIGFLLELEELLDVTIRKDLPTFTGWRFFWRGENGAICFAEWAVRVAQCLSESKEKKES